MHSATIYEQYYPKREAKQIKTILKRVQYIILGALERLVSEHLPRALQPLNVHRTGWSIIKSEIKYY